MTTKSVSRRGESIHEVEVNTLHGQPARLAEHEGKVVLAVNVASKCGLTPHYAGLQAVHDKYTDQGFTVIGFPCNQFAGQEPGTAEEIHEFCSLNFGVTFPLYEKVDVKGDDQHPVYAILSAHPYDDSDAGDVLWNFEKFLVGKDGKVVRRFKPTVKADDPVVVEAIEALL
jgi:glutathione peroxidase